LNDLEEFYNQSGRPSALKLVNGYDGKSTWIKSHPSSIKETFNNLLKTPVKNSEARSSLRSKSHDEKKTPPKTKQKDQKDVPIMKIILNKITTNIPQNLKNIFAQEHHHTAEKTPTNNNNTLAPPPEVYLQRQASIEKSGFLERRRHSSGLVFVPADKANGESPEMKKKDPLHFVGINSQNSGINFQDRNKFLDSVGSFGNLDNAGLNYSYKTTSEKLPGEISLESSFMNNEGETSRNGHHRSRNSGDFTYASSFHNVKRYTNSLQELFGKENLKGSKQQCRSEVLDKIKINQSLDNFVRPHQHSKYSSNLMYQNANMSPNANANSDDKTPYFPSSSYLE